MPQAVAIPAITAALGAGATIYGAKKSSDTAKSATKSQLAANDAALAYQREQDAKAEARQAQIDAEERAAWEAEQIRLAPLRALKEALAGQTAGRIGLPFDVSGLGDAKPYPGSGGNMGAPVAPLSALKQVRGAPAAVSPALPDPMGLSEEDPYTTSAMKLADIAKGGWRLGR